MNRANKKSPSLPYCLKGHMWIYEDWAKKCGFDIVAAFPPLVLVRERGKGQMHWRLSDASTKDIATDARLGLQTLLDRAEAGDEDAATCAAQLIRQSCGILNKLAEHNPKLFRRTGRTSWRWPVLMSLHPHLCEDFKPLLKSIEFGADIPIELDPGARWVWDDASDVAFGLLCYLREYLQQDKLFHYNARLTRSISKLPEFTSDTSEQWWRYAKAALLTVYPAPQSIPELDKLVKARTKRLSPGRIKAAILEMLHDRFVSFARPPAPYRT
jgi:hypothetical protein